MGQALNSGFDVIHACEMGFPVWLFHRFVVCGGMAWYTANSRTFAFLKLLEQQCAKGGVNKCNDQVEVNKFILLPELGRVVWKKNPLIYEQQVNSTDANNGMFQIGMVGQCNVTGHTIKIWHRDFAWRGPIEIQHCPSENNWVAMPGPLPWRNTSGKSTTKERLDRFDFWESYCGKNGTNRPN